MKVLFMRLMYLLITPLYLIALPQGLWLRRKTLRMPEARGPRTMSLGSKPNKPLNLLYLGESPAAGVGMNDIKDALSTRVAHGLTDTHAIDLQLVAENGITSKELLDKLKGAPTLAPDVSVITMGVNDCTCLTPFNEWDTHINGLADELTRRGSKHIFFTGVPPLQDFPLLPAPLSWVMGYRSVILNTLLQEMCHRRVIKFLPFSSPINKEMMAIDGYHPNEEGAAIWAESISKHIKPVLRA